VDYRELSPSRIDRELLPPCDASPMTDAAPGPHDPLHFACPRCATAVDEHWYGPCATCRAALRSEMRGAVADVASGPYEPKRHVTPNAVALKE